VKNIFVVLMQVLIKFYEYEYTIFDLFSVVKKAFSLSFALFKIYLIISSFLFAIYLRINSWIGSTVKVILRFLSLAMEIFGEIVFFIRVSVFLIHSILFVFLSRCLIVSSYVRQIKFNFVSSL